MSRPAVKMRAPINYGFDHTAVTAAVASPPPGVALAGVALAATPGGPAAAAAAVRAAVTGAAGGGPALVGVRLNPALLPAGETLGGPTAAAVVATAGSLGVPVNVFCRPPDGDGLAALAAGHPSLSAPFRVSNVAAPYGDLAGWAAQAVGVFGADRLMWGSDWPYVEEAGGYAAAWAAADVVLGGVSDADRALILGGTAAAVYGL
ncbi:hypothetical protein I4F81_009551 [Pyropia yezoensis]|uniref:Uncharacterized protein n=1 Tax=Pyropia yezoensis TaxID=2788 RepID=A0ACC3CAN4_PYRYE|nr:hypothetical protein I4F81_009551 [Neopyropia yezoensis]